MQSSRKGYKGNDIQRPRWILPRILRDSECAKRLYATVNVQNPRRREIIPDKILNFLSAQVGIFQGAPAVIEK
jgi:hypothetical protein